MKYDNIKDNEWQTPIYRGYKIICCDCGLVHKVDFRYDFGQIQFRVKRDNRATARARAVKK